MPNQNIVYVLSNPAMPGLVKIGITTDDPNTRPAQLYTSGVPFPFNTEYAVKVDNASEIEKSLHEAFAPQRVNPKREFFNIKPEQVKAILRIFGEDISRKTEQEEEQNNPEIHEAAIAAEQYKQKKKRPLFYFGDCGIPVGAELTFINDTSIKVTVQTTNTFPNLVIRKDETEPVSLREATVKLLGVSSDRPLQPIRYWTYNGKLLLDIYDETYSKNDTDEIAEE